MKKYIVYLIGWDFDTSQEIEASNPSKAKGQYIKENLHSFMDGYPKAMFFQQLRCNRA